MERRDFLTFLCIGIGTAAVASSPCALALTSVSDTHNLGLAELMRDPTELTEVAVASPRDMEEAKIEMARYRYHCRYYRRHGTLRRYCLH